MCATRPLKMSTEIYFFEISNCCAHKIPEHAPISIWTGILKKNNLDFQKLHQKSFRIEAAPSSEPNFWQRNSTLTISCAHFCPAPLDSLNASPKKNASHHVMKCNIGQEFAWTNATPQSNEIRASEEISWKWQPEAFTNWSFSSKSRTPEIS